MVATCPAHCGYHGDCVEGLCYCHAGFAGADCSVRNCPADCSGNGECLPHANFSCACYEVP